MWIAVIGPRLSRCRPKGGPESPAGLRGAGGGAQKGYRLEVWPPLALGAVGLAARHGLDLTGLDQAHPEAAVCQDLQERNPENARGLQRHGFQAARLDRLRKNSSAMSF